MNPRPYEIKVRRPSDVGLLGVAMAREGASDGDAMRALAKLLPLQMAHVLRQRGIDEASVESVVEEAERNLVSAAVAYETLIHSGEAIQRVADSMVALLKAGAARPVTVMGYSITGT
jgi:hypothetical protein